MFLFSALFWLCLQAMTLVDALPGHHHGHAHSHFHLPRDLVQGQAPKPNDVLELGVQSASSTMNAPSNTGVSHEPIWRWLECARNTGQCSYDHIIEHGMLMMKLHTNRPLMIEMDIENRHCAGNIWSPGYSTLRHQENREALFHHPRRLSSCHASGGTSNHGPEGGRCL